MAREQGSLTLFDLAHRVPFRRRIEIVGKLTNQVASRKMAELNALQIDDGNILVTFNTGGGHTSAGLNLCEAFSKSSQRTIGLVDREGMSAGFMALQGCHVRIAKLGSIIGIHNPESSDQDPLPIKHNSTEEEYLKEKRARFRMHQALVRQQREKMLTILLERSVFKDREKLEKFLETAGPMSPGEALKLGFLDGVV